MSKLEEESIGYVIAEKFFALLLIIIGALATITLMKYDIASLIDILGALGILISPAVYYLGNSGAIGKIKEIIRQLKQDEVKRDGWKRIDWKV